MPEGEGGAPTEAVAVTSQVEMHQDVDVAQWVTDMTEGARQWGERAEAVEDSNDRHDLAGLQKAEIKVEKRKRKSDGQEERRLRFSDRVEGKTFEVARLTQGIIAGEYTDEGDGKIRVQYLMKKSPKRPEDQRCEVTLTLDDAVLLLQQCGEMQGVSDKALIQALDGYTAGFAESDGRAEKSIAGDLAERLREQASERTAEEGQESDGEPKAGEEAEDGDDDTGAVERVVEEAIPDGDRARAALELIALRTAEERMEELKKEAESAGGLVGSRDRATAERMIRERSEEFQELRLFCEQKLTEMKESEDPFVRAVAYDIENEQLEAEIAQKEEEIQARGSGMPDVAKRKAEVEGMKAKIEENREKYEAGKGALRRCRIHVAEQLGSGIVEETPESKKAREDNPRGYVDGLIDKVRDNPDSRKKFLKNLGKLGADKRQVETIDALLTGEKKENWKKTKGLIALLLMLFGASALAAKNAEDQNKAAMQRGG